MLFFFYFILHTYTIHARFLSLLTSLSCTTIDLSWFICQHFPSSHEIWRTTRGFDYVDMWGNLSLYILFACVAQEAIASAWILLLSFPRLSLSLSLSPGYPIHAFQLIYTNRQHKRRLLSSDLFFSCWSIVSFLWFRIQVVIIIHFFLLLQSSTISLIQTIYLPSIRLLNSAVFICWFWLLPIYTLLLHL